MASTDTSAIKLYKSGDNDKRVGINILKTTSSLSYNLQVNGTANISGALSAGSISAGSLSLTTALPVSQGGTGRTALTGSNSLRSDLGLGTGSGALAVANGGTGATTFTAGTLLTGNGTSAITGYTPAWQAWTAGTTAGPKAKIKLGNVDYESAAIPSASVSASGIVTTGDQSFKGTKGFNYIWKYARNSSGTATRYPDDVFLYNNAGTQVGERWYDCGDATNISKGQFCWREYSPNSTASTTTTGKYEDYCLPAVTAGRTTNNTYTILTTRDTVTVAQGGTGVTSIADIRAGKDGDGNTITSKYVTLDTAQTISGVKKFYQRIYVQSNDGTGVGLAYSLDGGTTVSAIIGGTRVAVNGVYHTGNLAFVNYSYNSSTGAILSTYENYKLPTVTADRSSTGTYFILTSKNASTTSNVYSANTLPTTWASFNTESGLHYHLYLIFGIPTTNASYTSIVVPWGMIDDSSSTTKAYQLADNSGYHSFKLYRSGSTVYIKHNGGTNGYVIVYGMFPQYDG